MKKTNFNSILILLLLILPYIGIKAQDKLNPPKLQRLDTTTAVQRTQNKFILGWNWGSPCRTLDEALKINSYHQLNPINSTDIPPGILLMTPLGRIGGTQITGGRTGFHIFNAQCIQLEPTLSSDASGNTLPRDADSSKAVFGFKYRNKGIISNTGIDAQRFKLSRSSVSTKTLVLKDITGGDILRWCDYPGATSIEDSLLVNTANDIKQYHHFNGKQIMLSINLRATDTTQIAANLDSEILTIKLKYLTGHRPIGTGVITPTPDSNGYIRFCKFPKVNIGAGSDFIQNINSTVNDDFRGVARDTTAPTSLSDEIKITGRMLRNWLATAPDNSLTMSAFANVTGMKTGNTYDDNPVLSNDYWWDNYKQITQFITGFDVEVYYSGKIDVAIDWIRIETPQYRELIRGRYDALIAARLKNEIDTIRKYRPDQRIYRFCAMDEFWTSNWHSQRYLNKLVDGNLAGEVGSCDANRLMLATDFKEFWGGSLSMPPKAKHVCSAFE